MLRLPIPLASNANQTPSEAANCKTDSVWDGRKETVVCENPLQSLGLVRVLQLDPFATEKENKTKQRKTISKFL